MRRLAWIACALAAAAVRAAEPAATERAAVEFVRVHVPDGKVADVPLGGERHVPMPTAEFERAVARLQSPAVPRGLPAWIADSASYECAVAADGRLEGRLRFDVGAAAAALAGDVVLGAVDARSGIMTTADGVGDAVIFGTPGGAVAMRTPDAGRYQCDFAIAPAPTPGEFVVPLVPALATTVQLDLPAGLAPRFVHEGGDALVVELPAGSAEPRRSWHIDAGPAAGAVVVVAPRDPLPPRLRVWTRALLHPRRVDLVARVVPEAAWSAGQVVMRCDAGFIPTACSAAGVGEIGLRDVQATEFHVELPAALAGSTVALEIRGVADMAGPAARALPLVRPPAERWAGGGTTVVVDREFVIAGMALEEGVAVAPETAAGWPMPAAASEDVEAACLHVEQQAPGGRVVVELRPREAVLDVARVTTVEVSPAAVLGRASCDIRVMAGEAFGLNAEVVPGWFIDSVEAVDWIAGEAEGDGPADAGTALKAIAVPSTDRAIDWRIVRSPTSSELRIGLAEAATRTRGLGLRITGHRSGVPIGGEFLTGDMDMLRIDGEREGSSLVDFRVGAEELIEIEGEAAGLLPVEGRLARLVEPGTPRGRIRGGGRAPLREARLVQRRPPLTADVLVKLVAGEGRLSQTTTFACRPDAGVLDAIVVHGSEPTGDDVQWSVVSPATAAVVARRLDAGAEQRGEVAGQSGIAQSWLLEFRPPVTGEVVFQSTRTVPFTGPQPVPLAWVEGCTSSRGTVEVRSAGREPLRIVNRRLREVPPAAIIADGGAAPRAEFAYGGPAAISAAGPPAAEIAPAAADSGRAWAWREVMNCTCHASGRIECEVIYDIENRGRETVTLDMPEGLRVDAVLVDGLSVAVDAPTAAGGEMVVALPEGRDRVRLVICGVADRQPRFGIWRIDPVAVAIDMPVLGRTLELMLPPDVDLLSGGAAASGGSWLARLFDAEPDVVRRSAADDVDTLGFRRVEVPVARAAASRPLVARRSVIASVSLLAGLATAAAALLLMRRRPTAVALAAVGLAIAALWVDSGVAAVVRAGWWGLLAGAWCAGPARVTLRPATVGLLLAIGWSAAVADERGDAERPYRVLLSPGENGGTALVPEPLYRLLAVDDAAAASAVRVVTSRVLAGGPGPDDWRLVVELDADRGGVLVLDQRPAGSRWLPPVGRPPAGVLVELDATATLARLVALAPGRHRVELGIAPAISQLGGVQTSTACVPPAPRSTVELAAVGDDPARPDPRRLLCEQAGRTGAWIRATRNGSGFDVSRAARVRLTRSLDPRGGIATSVPQARSGNDVIWSGEGCRVEATFEIEAGTSIVPSVIVRASPGLEPQPRGDAVCSPLGGGRYLLERAEPTAGRSRIAVAFTMPLVDPVGVFEVPEAWLEGVGADDRTVRFVAPATLDVTPELPGSMSLLRAREPERPEVVAVWRSESISAGPEHGAGGVFREAVPADRQRPRVAVRRRSQPPRGSQRLQVTFAEAHVGLSLLCQIESTSVPLAEVPVDLPAECVVDRVIVERETDDEAAPVDVAVMRRSQTRIDVVVQRPRSGRFRLRVDARLPGPPATRGRMPLARAMLPGEVPLVVTWLAESGQAVEVSGAVPRTITSGLVPVEGDDFIEVQPGEEVPGYVFAEADVVAPSSPAPPAAPAAAAPASSSIAVDLETVHLVLEPRGRVWGTARFDLVVGDRRMLLQLPAGMRLFDVLVDGRETEAVPEATDTWAVTLDDVRWPRSLMVVFSGDVAGGLDGGLALRLDPPRLVGMPATRVLWSIDPPPAMQLRIAEPADVLTQSAWHEAAAEASGRLADAFAAAIEAAEGAERTRLVEIAARRTAGGTLPREALVEAAVVAADDRSRSRVFVATDGDAPVTVRAARAIDPTTPTRGLVTVGIVAALAAGWSLAGRWPTVWAGTLRRAWPWIAVAVGTVWVATLEPTLPGAAILAVGGITLAARRTRAVADGATDDVACGSTRTLRAR